MAWAIKFISQSELGLDENYREILPPNFEGSNLAAEVPDSIDLTAYSTQLTQEKKDKIRIAQHGTEIALPSPIVDPEMQGYFQFTGNQLWYRDGPVGRASQNGTGILCPREEGGNCSWNRHDWMTLRNIFIPILSNLVYMIFPGGVISKKFPSYLALVYLFQELPSEALGAAQATQQTPASVP